MGSRRFLEIGDLGQGRCRIRRGAAAAAGQRNADVGADDLVFAGPLAGNMEAEGRVGQAVATRPAGGDAGALCFATRQFEFVAVFEDGAHPVGFAALDRRRIDNGGRRADRQTGIAAPQVFGGSLLADTGLGELRGRLGQRRLSLDRFEARGVAQLLAALDRLGLLFQQCQLLAPLGAGGTFLEPDKPRFQQLATGLVQRVAMPGFGQCDAGGTQFAVQRSLAGQPYRALNGGVPFVEALVRPCVGAAAALLAAQAKAPFVAARFQAAAIGLFDPNLAAGRLYRRVGKQDAGDDLGGREGAGDSAQKPVPPMPPRSRRIRRFIAVPPR